jgi:hypothetical protein
VNNGYGHYKAHSNRSVEWNCESPNPAIVRIPFPYDEREGQPAQASANHLSMKVRLPERPNPPFKVDDPSTPRLLLRLTHPTIVFRSQSIANMYAQLCFLFRHGIANYYSTMAGPGAHPIHIHPARPLYRFAATGLGASMWFFVCLNDPLYNG